MSHLPFLYRRMILPYIALCSLDSSVVYSILSSNFLKLFPLISLTKLLCVVPWLVPGLFPLVERFSELGSHSSYVSDPLRYIPCWGNYLSRPDSCYFPSLSPVPVHSWYLRPSLYELLLLRCLSALYKNPNLFSWDSPIFFLLQIYPQWRILLFWLHLTPSFSWLAHS